MRDAAAEFAEFYEQNRSACYRAVRAAIGNADLTEDLVAESFARAWASWDTVRRHPAPQAWVVRTCLNANVSWWRRRRRETAWPAELDPLVPATDATPVDAALLAALRQLPARQREVVVLRVFLDLDSHTTAATLGIAAATVRVHLHRALASLRSSHAARAMSVSSPIKQEQPR